MFIVSSAKFKESAFDNTEKRQDRLEETFIESSLFIGSLTETDVVIIPEGPAWSTAGADLS